MPEPRGRQSIPAGSPEVELPQGVTAADWGLERVRVQNPSLRSYLGCLRLLEEVLDSNYAILHCSPERVLKIWSQVRQVCHLMRTELLPTLSEPSVIPGLDEARRHAASVYQALADTVLTDMERYEQPLRADQLPKVRKLLCVLMGKIYAFLRDTFGEIVATDPRSRHDADYFLSRRFTLDIEESEWLYSSVYEVHDLLVGVERVSTTQLGELVARMRQERMIPPDSDWERVRRLLGILLGEVMPKLKEVLSLRGTRVNDMESLQSHATQVSAHSQSVMDTYTVGREVIEELKGVGGPTLQEREQRVNDLIGCHRVVSGRMVAHLTALQASLHDLTAQVGASKAGIEKRRALMLARDPTDTNPKIRIDKPSGAGP
jgi:hypothetical protein